VNRIVARAHDRTRLDDARTTVDQRYQGAKNADMVATHVLAGTRPAFRLQLCGDAALFAGDGVSLGSQLGVKAMALLAYLALEPGPHSRESLTALLWGEYPDEKAKASLRQVLSHLRDALGDAINVGRTTVALAPNALTCDVAEFLGRAERAETNAGAARGPGTLEEALAVDVPRFLASLGVRNSPAFEEWTGSMRARLVRGYLRLLAIAARGALARRAWREAGRLADKWVALAPFDDEPVGVLMEAQFLAGHASDALAIYREHATRLAAEVQRVPNQTLVELAARIRHESRDSRPARPPRGANGWHEAVSFSASLIGRSSEWEALEQSWETVCEGTARVVLIEGEPGAGKTRVGDTFLRWVTTRGGTALRGAGYDAHTGAPFGAVIDLLRSGLSAPGLAGAEPESLAEVARLLPELRRRFPGLPDASAPRQAVESWRLFEAVAQTVLAIADEGPLLVFIDDLQWCDADSCSLLQFLIRRTSEAPVLWCITFTAGGVARDAPAARLYRALRLAGGTVAVALGPLGEEDVWSLIHELSHIDSPTAGRRLAARIHAVTAGNAFYVIELLRTLFARRLLAVHPETGAWIVGSADNGGTTAPLFAQTVHDAIAERVEGLPEELHAVLATIAVAGRGCTPDIVSRMHGISRLHAAALGEALIERHLVVDENGRYRCAHPILADVVRSRLSASLRRETHRALAVSLELLLSSSGWSDGEMGEIARHAEQAGDCGMAYRYALLSADACSRRSAFEEALSWLDLAASCAETTDESQIVGRHSARVLEEAGWREAPAVRPARGTLVTRVDLADLDLPG
jgi:DNA-binding SARP family transcriptional activator